uniref:DUF4167 domain-containing protein n=1 Tax=uncultured Sphingomonas sp. TaxID=158754 RepID=UPI0025D7554A|nr:DUF4167 domain-containing protein [uncultured Sphingomonas sp.]
MNNRQQGGRRRGRGGQRPPGAPGNGGGARDNRQRGNAAQLLEKYKSMARDAQLAGDRVQTEYYLQFADHYFRVLGETRSRFEEQRRGREDYDDDEEYDDEVMEADGEDRQEPRPGPRDGQARGRRNDGDGDGRRERSTRDDRSDRRERRDRYNGERYNGADGDEAEAAPREAEQRIVADILPPAIGLTEDTSDPVEAAGQEEAPRPRRRTRRPRVAEGGDEIAPAA